MKKNCKECGFAYNHRGPNGIKCSLTNQPGDECVAFVSASKFEQLSAEGQEELFEVATKAIETKYYSHCPKCEDCGQVLIPDVQLSNAGYYVGTMCHCGPYSRDSGYYKTREAAKLALENGLY